MDLLDILPVRFHFGCEFQYDGLSLYYARGQVAVSDLERDKLSILELRGHLIDHVALSDEYEVDFHWLPPGVKLSTGLRKLVDDQSVMTMSDYITEGGVAEVYAEIFKYGRDGNVVMWSEGQPAGIIVGEPNISRVYITPSKEQTARENDSSGMDTARTSGEQGNAVDEENDSSGSGFAMDEEENDSSGSGFTMDDEDNSEDDEKAHDFRIAAREITANQMNAPSSQNKRPRMTREAVKELQLIQQGERGKITWLRRIWLQQAVSADVMTMVGHASSVMMMVGHASGTTTTDVGTCTPLIDACSSRRTVSIDECSSRRTAASGHRRIWLPAHLVARQEPGPI
ncbi:hypothetical protein ABZP36_032870 [Zizania latifolia]